MDGGFAGGVVDVAAGEAFLAEDFEDAEGEAGLGDGFHGQRHAAEGRGQVAAVEFGFEGLLFAVFDDWAERGVFVEEFVALATGEPAEFVIAEVPPRRAVAPDPDQVVIEVIGGRDEAAMGLQGRFNGGAMPFSGDAPIDPAPQAPITAKLVVGPFWPAIRGAGMNEREQAGSNRLMLPGLISVIRLDLWVVVD